MKTSGRRRRGAGECVEGRTALQGTEWEWKQATKQRRWGKVDKRHCPHRARSPSHEQCDNGPKEHTGVALSSSDRRRARRQKSREKSQGGPLAAGMCKKWLGARASYICTRRLSACTRRGSYSACRRHRTAVAASPRPSLSPEQPLTRPSSRRQSDADACSLVVSPQTSVRRPRPPSWLAIAPTLHGRPVKRFHSTTPTRASPARNLHYRPDKLFGRSTHRTNRAATAGSACRRLAKQGTHIICTSARYAARDPASTAEGGCRAVEADGPR